METNYPHVAKLMGVDFMVGVLHWVVLETVMPEGMGGLVHLYNPFTNGMEMYSWGELVASMGQPYGVVAER